MSSIAVQGKCILKDVKPSSSPFDSYTTSKSKPAYINLKVYHKLHLTKSYISLPVSHSGKTSAEPLNAVKYNLHTYLTQRKLKQVVYWFSSAISLVSVVHVKFWYRHGECSWSQSSEPSLIRHPKIQGLFACSRIFINIISVVFW